MQEQINYEKQQQIDFQERLIKGFNLRYFYSMFPTVTFHTEDSTKGIVFWGLLVQQIIWGQS